MERIDETALNVLLLDSAIAPGVAYAASIDDGDDVLPATRSNRYWWDMGLLLGLALFILWQLW